MTSLYEINNNIRNLLEYGWDEDCVDMETGEILYDLASEKLDALLIEEKEKVEGVTLFIKSLNAETSAIKAEEKALMERRKSKERKTDSLKRYLAGHLLSLGESKFETPRCALSFRKSEALEITDENALRKYTADYDCYLKYKDPEIDKMAVKTAIKKGENIPGAELVERQNLQIK